LSKDATFFICTFKKSNILKNQNLKAKILYFIQGFNNSAPKPCNLLIRRFKKDKKLTI